MGSSGFGGCLGLGPCRARIAGPIENFLHVTVYNCQLNEDVGIELFFFPFFLDMLSTEMDRRTKNKKSNQFHWKKGEGKRFNKKRRSNPKKAENLKPVIFIF